MLRMGRKRGLFLVWLVVFLLLTVPLYGQSILTQAVSGTGFIVSSDGYIITNRHVINGATKISVTIGNKEYEATVVDSLSDNDIALLKVDAHGLPTVMLGDSDNVQIGDTVYAIGCPAGVCGTITQGRVANLGISSKTDEGTTLHNLIMSDLTTTHGSSGGPLLNDKGEVIGITTAGIVVQGETTGFGVSIPISQAIPLLRQVPGFSTSQMGNATTVLSLDGIRRSVGPDTAFVEAEVQRTLSDFLPKEALGVRLDVTADEGFPPLGLLPSASAYADVKHGQTLRSIEVKIWKYSNPEEACQNQEVAFDFLKSRKKPFVIHVLLKDSRSAGNTDLLLQAEAGVIGLINANIEVDGYAAFNLGDLVFLITLSDGDTHSFNLPIECCRNFSWQKNNGQITLTCDYQSIEDTILGNPPVKHVYQSSINVDRFLHDFQGLIDTVLNTALAAMGSQ